METADSNEFVLDIRTLTRTLRHRLIFLALDALAPGQTLRLINDHDPSPLSFQLRTTRPGHFAWVAGERGPKVWSAAITRVGATSDAATPAPPIEATQSVHQIMSRYPHLRVTLVRYGIDLCCCGGLSLRQAAVVADVALEDLLAALNERVAAVPEAELSSGDV